MKLREIAIKNFRNLADINIPVDDTTILVGENNAGKTTLLQALRVALPRSTTIRGTPFDEFDYHMCQAGDNSQTSEGIVIELWFREDNPDEWPDSLLQSLAEIIQTDPIHDLDSIGLRLSSKYDADTKQMISKWEFLNLNKEPLGGRGANPVNYQRFLSYVRLFYLSALRDSDQEFSPRSQFWGSILRDLRISDEQRSAINEDLIRLNEALLGADPRLEQVRVSIENVQKVIALGGHHTSIQALPLRHSELMSKSQVVIRGKGSEVDFPLSRHGQGVQSLAVLFLFQAYIDVLLKPSFQPETEALLALEEPEAHLHPQAARALGASLIGISTQKIISTHSPYFIQEIPFKQIRMFRSEGPRSKVLYIRRFFTAHLPDQVELVEFCTNNSPKYTYDRSNSTLRLSGKMEAREYRRLLPIYPGQGAVHAELKRLYQESQSYLTDEQLDDLETYAKRIRGEILFARAWLLCEGQTEYILLRYFAELLGRTFDQLGVTVIDFQNNGSPGAFVRLARAFEIPWIMICDNDDGGRSFVREVRNCSLTDQEINHLVRPLPEAGEEIEKYLVRSGFVTEYHQILTERGINLTKHQGENGFEEEICTELKKDKTGFTNALVRKLKASGADERRIPEFLRRAIDDIIEKAD